MNNISIVLVGLSSYGTGYARLLIEQGHIHNASLVGIVDPYAEKNPFWPTVKEHNIPHYDALSEFLAGHQADLAAIASPIHLHYPQTCSALQAGMRIGGRHGPDTVHERRPGIHAGDYILSAGNASAPTK